MASKQTYPIRDYAVGQYVLTLRSRAKLTQAALADRIGVHRRSVQKWESGETYPTAENLRTLIAVLLPLGAFTPGQERVEAADLWQQVSRSAPQPLPFFDEVWFHQLTATPQPQSPNHEPTSSNAVSLPPPPDQARVPRERQMTPPLPFIATPLIGRSNDLTRIAQILDNPACRLLTLIGPGGIGKTRLALEVAARQAGTFSDGAAFVALASIGSPDQIISAIGDALNLSFSGPVDLFAYLRERHMLLLLDDFEHLLDGANLLADMLQAAPHLTILVTSRARLNLLAEWLFDVEGLSYPPTDAFGWSVWHDASPLTDYGAVQLFTQRATQIQPDLPLTDDTLMTIVRICQHVAGIPLAIELAAAGVRLLPVNKIEQQLHANLDALATTLRDVPPRHRNMRAVFDHSWNLLTEAEQAVFSRLAVFRGGWDQAAVEGICSEVTGHSEDRQNQDNPLPFLSHTVSPTLLASLIDKSLVRRRNGNKQASGASKRTNASIGPRFFLLEPTREYAMEQLAARGEVDRLQHAHANYYLALAEAVDALRDNATHEPIDREYDNLYAALQWACGSGQYLLGLKLAGVLWRFWRRRGYISEGRVWLEELLALVDTTSSDPTVIDARLNALQGAAWLASYQHDFAHAAQIFEQSMALRRNLGDTKGDTSLLDNAARAWRSAGQYRRALPLLEEALAQHRALNNRDSMETGGLGFSLFELAMILREMGDFARAADLLEECLTFHRALGDREGRGIALLGLSDIARDQGDIAQIRKYGEESLSLLRELGVQWAAGFALNNLALAAYRAGDLSQAFLLINESVTLYRSQQAEASLAEILVTLGHILRAQGDVNGAHAALTEALGFAQTVGPRLFVAAALEALASLAPQPGQSALVVRLLGAASALRGRMSAPIRPAEQPEVERILTTARAYLGADAFAELWAEAEMLPIGQIIIPDATSLVAEAAAPDVHSRGTKLTHYGRQRVDWGLAQDVPVLYGRANELALLTRWVIENQCRVISLVGIGGIGKTSLAVTLARQIASHFEVVIFQSLGEAPPFTELLDHLIRRITTQQIIPPPQSTDKLTLLIDLLRETRCLLILDNLETLMQAGTTRAQYRPGYEDYSTLFQQLGATAHQGCLILTSRERPNELASLEGPRAPVRILRITGLSEDASRALLADQELIGTTGDAAALARRYGGNPLALKLVAEPIRAIFGGDIVAFLTEGMLFSEGVSHLLEQQINRASILEQALLTWLTIGREPVTLDQIMGDMLGNHSRAAVLTALHALWRRNLIERGHENLSFTLQRVVLEYLTEHLVARAADEIVQGAFDILRNHALIQATAKEYVRRNQGLLIATPLLSQLAVVYGEADAVEQRLLNLLTAQRDRALPEQGYGPGNVINLLRLLRDHLRGLDLTRLALRQTNLQSIEMHDTNLAGAMLQDNVFTETFDVMTAVDISSSGDYWAAASRRGEILVWATGGLTLHRMWRAHTDMIWTLAFSPDGRWLASGSWDGAVKLWDVVSGALLWTGRHTSHANWVAFAPDGSMLASSGDDATVRLWDLQNGTPLQALPHPGPISGIAWSPVPVDDTGELILASGDLEGTIRLWTVSKTKPATCVQTIEGHTNWVDGLAFAPDGRILASASWDGTVKLWDTSTVLSPEASCVRLQKTLEGHTDRVVRVAWSSEENILASCSRDRTIWLWDVEHGNARMVLQGHTAGVDGVAFTPDAHNLLTGSEDGTLRVWGVDSGQCVRIIQGYAASLYDIDWSPDGTHLVSGGSDYLVTIYSVAGGALPKVLSGHSGVVFGVGWSPDGQWLASSEWDNVIRLWSPTSGECLHILQHPDDAGNFFYGLTWSPDGQHLACGTYRRGVQVFDMTTHRPLWVGHEFPTWIRHVAWSPDGTLLAGGGDDGTVYVWDAANGRLLRQMTGHYSMVTRVAWSLDGTRLVSGSRGKEGGELFVWNVQRGEVLCTLVSHPRIVYAIAWASENIVVSGGGNGKLYWWDIERGQSLWVREAHEGTVQSLRRSPDGTKLVSAGDDGAVMLWDSVSGEHLQTLRRDRPYERLNITGIKGLTEAQRTNLLALGAIEME